MEHLSLENKLPIILLTNFDTFDQNKCLTLSDFEPAIPRKLLLRCLAVTFKTLYDI